MASFEPDEPITSIKVKVQTADVADGGTDGDVFVELFDWPKNFPKTGLETVIPFRAELDKPNYDDFERGDKDTYWLPDWYFKDRIVNDIRRVCVHKSEDSAWGGWAFAGITVWINGKELYSSVNPAKPMDVVKWLENDDRTWRGSFTPIEFVAPSIVNLNLPDASSNQDYSVELRAKGGRKPLMWSIVSTNGTAFTSGPKLVAPNADGTVIKLSGHTASTKTNASWTGTIRVRDADGRTSNREMTMKLVYTLPAPTVTDLTPRFGWPGLVPAEPKPTEVILTGTNFDSRSLSKTRVTFARAGGGFVDGKVLEATGSQLRVEVPAGAVPGQLDVATDFGKTTSPQVFTAHADGYRFRKGFSFRNRTDDGDSTDGFPDSFAWEQFEQTFGVDEMWVTVVGHGTIPDPVAAANYLALRYTIDDGCCHGFALTSLQMTKGIIPTSVYRREGSGAPLEDALFDLSKRDRPLTELSKTIQSRQLVMFSDEALSYYLDKFDTIPNVAGNLCQMDARPALEDMKKALQAKLADPRMLAFAKDCAPWNGHVVVPYALEPLQKVANITMQGIRVYDPNRPAFTQLSGDPVEAAKQKDAIAKSVLTVRTGDGRWSYPHTDGDLWQGLYMFTIPLSAYGHREDWSHPGLDTLGGTIGILLGSAGVAGSGQIAQVTDETGRGLFTADGSTVQDRSQWPANVRPIPFLDLARTKRMVVLTKPGLVRFTIRPEDSAGDEARQPLLFAIRCGGSFTVEQVDSELRVDFDPQDKRLRVAPTKGTASAIVRLIHRFDEAAETLGYAFRVADLAPDRPFEVRPAAGGRTVLVTPQGERTIDLEVTHTSRIGEQRILEADGITLPAGHAARFEVSDPEQLEVEGARPVLLSLEGPDAASQQELGRRILGPVVGAPHRVVVSTPRPDSFAGIPVPRPGKGLTRDEPPSAKTAVLEQGFPVARLAAVAAKREPLFEVPIAVSGLGGRGPAVRAWPLYHRFETAAADAAVLKLRMPAGTRPVQIIAEDADGRRSFPRTVFVTVAAPGEPVRSPLTLFGTDVDAQPGETVTVPIGVYTVDEKIRGLTVNLSVRRRLSGSGSTRLAFGSQAFTLSAPLAAVGGTVTAAPGHSQITRGLEASWNPQKAQSGRFDVGSLTLTIPPDMPLGSTFVLEGTGSVISAGGASPQRIPLNVLPVLVRIWGGPEPAELKIEGPGQVGEEGQAVFAASATGVPAGASNAGWWVESLGGRASVVPDEQNAQRATLQGKRAGWVALHVVVGRTTARHLVRITPTVKTPLPGIGPKPVVPH